MFKRTVWSTGAVLLAATFLAPVTVAEDLSTYSGAELFSRFCASCHGLKAEGEGPVAAFFRVAPPDLTQIARRHGGEFPYEKVREIIDGRKSLHRMVGARCPCGAESSS